MSEQSGKRPQEGKDNKKAKRAKYFAAPKQGSGQALPNGSRGILVSCQVNWEDKAGREAVELIEEHYDKLAPKADDAKPAEGGKDIAALIAQEVAELKDKDTKKFKIHDTGLKGVVYVVFPQEPDSPTPQDVVTAIVDEAKDKKFLRARHCVKLFPITHTCFASLEEIKATAAKLLEQEFPQGDDVEAITYAVDYEHRSSDKFERLDVINCFAEAIKPPHKVNLSEPQKTIIVQLARNACGMSVVTKYKENSKFNLRKLTETE